MHATVMTSRARQDRRKLLEAEPREAEPDAARRCRAAVPAIIRTSRLVGVSYCMPSGVLKLVGSYRHFS